MATQPAGRITNLGLLAAAAWPLFAAECRLTQGCPRVAASSLCQTIHDAWLVQGHLCTSARARGRPSLPAVLAATPAASNTGLRLPSEAEQLHDGPSCRLSSLLSNGGWQLVPIAAAALQRLRPGGTAATLPAASHALHACSRLLPPLTWLPDDRVLADIAAQSHIRPQPRQLHSSVDATQAAAASKAAAAVAIGQRARRRPRRRLWVQGGALLLLLDDRGRLSPQRGVEHALVVEAGIVRRQIAVLQLQVQDKEQCSMCAMLWSQFCSAAWNTRLSSKLVSCGVKSLYFSYNRNTMKVSVQSEMCSG